MRIVPGNTSSQAITPATQDHGHRFARKRHEPPERCARHQVSGASILVAATRRLHLERLLRREPSSRAAHVALGLPLSSRDPASMSRSIGNSVRGRLTVSFHSGMAACDCTPAL